MLLSNEKLCVVAMMFMEKYILELDLKLVVVDDEQIVDVVGDTDDEKKKKREFI